MSRGGLGLFAVEAGLTAGCLLAATYLLAYPDPGIFLFYENGVARLALVAATLTGTMQLQGMYSPEIQRRRRLYVLQELCVALGVTFIAQGALAYMGGDLRAPARIVLAGGALAALAILAWRSLYGTVVWKAAERRVLFAGNSPLLDEAAAHLKAHPDPGLNLIGFAGEPPHQGEEPAVKHLGELSRLDEIVASARPDAIVIGLAGSRPGLPMTKLFELRTTGLRIQEDFTFVEQVCGYFSLKHLQPSRLIFSEELKRLPGRLPEVVDFAAAALALLVLLPALLTAALAIKLSSRGPVLQREPRVGKDGEVFPLYRFRHAGGLLRLPRSWNMEEWPRLLNVLRGDMSIVGPRPERPEFFRILSERIPFYPHRQVVKPGLTGWAQIHRGNRPEDTLTQLEYDFFYLKYRSQMLNNYIILRLALDLLRGGIR